MLEEVLGAFESIADMPITCYEKIERLFDFFVSTLDRETNVKILENFESYAAHFTTPLEDIGVFNGVYRQVSNVFSKIVEEGIRDGSLRQDLKVEETLITVINVVGLFARKLSLQKTF